MHENQRHPFWELTAEALKWTIVGIGIVGMIILSLLQYLIMTAITLLVPGYGVYLAYKAITGDQYTRQILLYGGVGLGIIVLIVAVVVFFAVKLDQAERRLK